MKRNTTLSLDEEILKVLAVLKVETRMTLGELVEVAVRKQYMAKKSR